MKQALLLLSLFSYQIAIAQNDWRLYEEKTVQDEGVIIEEETVFYMDTLSEGEVFLNVDPRIDTLVSALNSNPPIIKGYRVEIFFGKRKDAEQEKSAFLKNYQDWPIYIVWQQPNFKVQVGDFTTKLQAEKTKQAILSNYPNSYITITEIKISEN